MTIEFITEEDALYILPFFEEFLKTFADRFKVLQVSCCPVMGSRPRRQLVRELTWLYGLGGFSKLLSRYLVASVLGRMRRKANQEHYYSIEQLCNAYGVPYRSIGNPNAAAFVDGVRERAADLIVSVACPYILKGQILGLPRLGCINLHHAPLPRYKGMMPTFWQLYHGETRVGLTIHSMVEKIDEGSAFLQESIAVQPNETLDQLIRRSKRRAAFALAKVLEEIESNTCRPVPLSQEGSTYFTFPNREQIRTFRRRGFRAI